MFELMALMAAIPDTGDNFETKKFLFIGAAALVVIIGLSIAAGIAGKNKKDDDDDDN